MPITKSANPGNYSLGATVSLGSLGLLTPRHPAGTYIQGQLTDVPFEIEDPVVCVVYQPHWKEVDKDNLCKKQNNNLPPLPAIGVIAGFNPINQIIRARTEKLRAQSGQKCGEDAAYNFWFAALILKAFREDQKNRKELIYALAKNLSKANFTDIDGHPVQSGMQSTLIKNLTYGNGDGNPQITFLNSLKGLNKDNWLSEIRVSPTLIYQDFLDNGPEKGCISSNTPVGFQGERHPRKENAQKLLDSDLDPSHNLRSFANDDLNMSADPNNTYAYSLGVEKNPWIWAYVGLKVETTPRQLFFPLGPNVRMVARAFAKPFGGRMGPWYGKSWPQKANRSSDSRNAIIDPLLPLRNLSSGTSIDPADLSRLPNYSRFPGRYLWFEISLGFGLNHT